VRGLRALAVLVATTAAVAGTAGSASAGRVDAGLVSGAGASESRLVVEDAATAWSGAVTSASAAGVPTIAGHWKARFLGVAGTPLERDFTFRPCRGCAAIVGVTDPFRQGASRPVRMTRRGGLFVGVYRSSSCGGYTQVVRFRPGRGRVVEGQRFAVRGTGSTTSRTKRCDPRYNGTLRFKARRISDLRVVGAHISRDELGDGCNPYPNRFEAESGSFPDNFSRGGYSWSWDFGDGATSTERRPRHTFSSHGRYFVKVTIRLTDGSVAKGREPFDVSEPEEGC
jgi:hypothetical protein